MATDYTVKIFDEFYNLNLVVSASEYEIVNSYFLEYLKDEKTAKSFSDVLFRISNLTQIPVLELLESFQNGNNPSISRTLAYYLNSVSNKTVLFGVENAVAPNVGSARNVIYNDVFTPAPPPPSPALTPTPAPPPAPTPK